MARSAPSTDVPLRQILPRELFFEFQAFLSRLLGEQRGPSGLAHFDGLGNRAEEGADEIQLRIGWVLAQQYQPRTFRSVDGAGISKIALQFVSGAITEIGRKPR